MYFFFSWKKQMIYAFLRNAGWLRFGIWMVQRRARTLLWWSVLQNYMVKPGTRSLEDRLRTADRKKRRSGKFEIEDQLKGPGHIWRWSFIFKLKSAEETKKTLPGGLPLISVGNVKQSWPTPEQLSQNQPFTPVVWSICNSNLGIAMKTTFCSGCLQEFI